MDIGWGWGQAVLWVKMEMRLILNMAGDRVWLRTGCGLGWVGDGIRDRVINRMGLQTGYVLG